jgi:hypothetical protein
LAQAEGVQPIQLSRMRKRITGLASKAMPMMGLRGVSAPIWREVAAGQQADVAQLIRAFA